MTKTVLVQIILIIITWYLLSGDLDGVVIAHPVWTSHYRCPCSVVHVFYVVFDTHMSSVSQEWREGLSADRRNTTLATG